ncbi:MAG: DNA phosphorothioation-dependent restriction protein DptF [Clostridium sp.]|nr:DNA phosphorothioation-dependent restriction protein DptF [Clostridium sp.]
MIENVQKNYRNDEDVLRETEINPSEEKRVKDSRLLYELSKLKESSMQAIENIEDFSEYKQYMHIEREVEKRLKKVLDESSKSPFASLVLLCGSVGDGKSHLLGRFRYYESEMMENFKIHNDATESFEPNQSSLDTLNRVLSGFRDENIAHSREKMF